MQDDKPYCITEKYRSMRKGVALEDSNVVSWARLAKYVTFNIFVAKHPTRVDRMQYTDKVVEFGIQSAKCLGTEMVWFGPMRPAAVAVQDSFKALKQLLVRNIKTIGPFKVSGSAEKTQYVTYLNWTIPIQQVFRPLLGLNHISSLSENRTSIGQ